MQIEIKDIISAVSILAIAYVGLRDLRNKNAGGDVDISKAYSNLIAELKASNAELKKEYEDMKGRLLEQDDLIEGLRINFEKLEKQNKEYLARLQLREMQLIAAKIPLMPFDAAK